MLQQVITAIALALLEWVTKRLEQPDTAKTAPRNDVLRDRIRERMHEYEDRARRAGSAGESGS